jgi:GST-like protein
MCLQVLKHSGKKMIDLYTYNTFNGQQISIALEEMNLEYNVHKIELFEGEQRSDSFLKINPSGRIPAIIDHQCGDNESLNLSQTMAILIYLADKSGQFIADKAADRAKTIEWLSFQSADISTNIFNSFLLKSLIKIPQPETAQILRQRAKKFYRVFDRQLAKTEYLVNNNYSIADISSFTVVNSIHTELPMDEYKNLNRWHQSISKRPAVIRGLAIP